MNFSFLLFHLDFKHASSRALLAIVNVYKIMIVLGTSEIFALLLAYLFNNLQFGFEIWILQARFCALLGKSQTSDLWQMLTVVCVVC